MAFGSGCGGRSQLRCTLAQALLPRPNSGHRISAPPRRRKCERDGDGDGLGGRQVKREGFGAMTHWVGRLNGLSVPPPPHSRLAGSRALSRPPCQMPHAAPPSQPGEGYITKVRVVWPEGPGDWSPKSKKVCTTGESNAGFVGRRVGDKVVLGDGSVGCASFFHERENAH